MVNQSMMQSDWKRDTTDHTKPKTIVSVATLSWWLTPCKKTKVIQPHGNFRYYLPLMIISVQENLRYQLLDSFQGYWWSKYFAIWLEQSQTQPKMVASDATDDHLNKRIAAFCWKRWVECSWVFCNLLKIRLS